MSLNPDSTTSLSYARACRLERNQHLLTEGSYICNNVQADIRKHQKTPQGFSRPSNRPTHPYTRPEVKKSLIALPITLVNKNISPFACKPQTKIQHGLGEILDLLNNSKDQILSTSAVENNTTEFAEKQDVELTANDALFDNFDKHFKIRFPAEGLPDVFNQQRRSPRRINKTLNFDDFCETSEANTLPTRRLRRDRSRQDLILDLENDSFLTTVNQTTNTLPAEDEQPPLKPIHRPIINLHPKNYILRNQTLTNQSREEESIKSSYLAMDKTKLNPVHPLCNMEKRGSQAFPIHNDFFFSNIDPNGSYQIYGRDPFDSTKSTKDSTKESFNLFERTRERLSALYLNNHRNGLDIKAVVAKNNKVDGFNIVKRNENSSNFYGFVNQEKRQARPTNEKEQLVLKTDSEDKENGVIRNPILVQLDRNIKYPRIARSVNNSMEEHSEQNGSTRHCYGLGMKEYQSVSTKSSQPNGKSAFALRDITNIFHKGYQMNPLLARDLKHPNEKRVLINTDAVGCIPKPANELLQMDRHKYQRPNISKPLFKANNSKRSISAPRR